MKNLFKRKTKPVELKNELRVDLVNYQSLDKQLNTIKKCLLVSDEDYTNMTFEDDLQSFNFSDLSDESRTKIIDIIKADNEKRIVEKLALTEQMTSNGPIIYPSWDSSKEPCMTGNVIHNLKITK